MKPSFIQRYFFAALLLIGFGLGAVLFWPYLITIFLAAVFAILFHPLAVRIQRVVKFKGLAALLTIICFVLILCTPLFFIGLVIVKQSQSIYLWLTSHGSLSTLITNVTAWLHHAFPTVNFEIQARVNSFITSFASKLTSVFTGTVSTIISFLLMLLVMFYFLKDGQQWKESMVQLSPLSSESNIKIIAVMKNTINGIIKGYFVVALAQGTVASVGLLIFHVPHAVLWGLFVAVASLIPSLGTTIVNVPIIIFLLAVNRFGSAVGYTLWSLLLTGTIDNVLNPIIVGRQIAIHPILVLLSVLGGITLFGPVGIVVGPLVISFIYALLAVYKHEMATEEGAVTISVE